MDNNTANKLYRPDFVRHLDLYLQAGTKIESDILFENVKQIVTEMNNDGVSSPIQFHYICSAVQASRIFWKIGLANQMPNILRVIELIYPDKVEARKLAQQLIIVAGKMSAHIHTKTSSTPATL